MRSAELWHAAPVAKESPSRGISRTILRDADMDRALCADDRADAKGLH